MNNHSENFSKASTLITEIKPLISKIEHCYATSKPQPPVFDYARIAARLPKAESRTSQPPKPANNIRKQMKKSSDELQKRNNVMIYGLKIDNRTVKDSVLKMFKEYIWGRGDQFFS